MKKKTEKSKKKKIVKVASQPKEDLVKLEPSFIKKYGRWLILLVAVWLMLVLFAYWSLELVFANRVAWGLQLSDQTVGGLSVQQLDQLFVTKKQEMSRGVDVYWGDKKLDTVQLTNIGFDLDLDSCRDKVLYFDKMDGFVTRQEVRAESILTKKHVQCDLYFDEFDYLTWLNQIKAQVNQPAKSYSVEKKDGLLDVVNGAEGKVVDEKWLKDKLLNKIKELDFQPINIKIIDQNPPVDQSMAEMALSKAKGILVNNKIDLIYKDRKIPLTVDRLYDWLKFEERQSDQGKKEYAVTFDLNSIDQFFNDTAGDFEIKPIDARLKMTEQGVKIESEGKDGLMINRIKFLGILEKSLGQQPPKQIDLPVEETKAMVDGKNIKDLGIVELLGSGESDFSWSPANRVHNIGVGAEKFNGTVIAPGEEFSFTSRLGVVGPDEGFLPELVIADNETRPEYGGGLCQVSTTMFRVAINAGLPITERHPHQYRVSYYEPAGMDATIYVPSPDLKFVNNTGNYILIESEVTDSTLRFNFYGKSDGRKIEVTQPDIYNITAPPAPVYIYTSSLAPGEKYQVDSAHAGADAIFYRTITTTDGKVNKEEFFSRYQAWPAKFKVGEGEVKKEETPAVNPATNTNNQDQKNNNQTKQPDSNTKEGDLTTVI